MFVLLTPGVRRLFPFSGFFLTSSSPQHRFPQVHVQLHVSAGISPPAGGLHSHPISMLIGCAIMSGYPSEA
jgi:hypothetical protein